MRLILLTMRLPHVLDPTLVDLPSGTPSSRSGTSRGAYCRAQIEALQCYRTSSGAGVHYAGGLGRERADLANSDAITLSKRGWTRGGRADAGGLTKLGV